MLDPEVSSNILNLLANLICENQAYKNVIYGNEAIFSLDSFKLFLSFRIRNIENNIEKDLDYFKALLQFFNTLFISQPFPPLEILSALAKFIFEKFSYIEYDYTLSELLLAVKNLTKYLNFDFQINQKNYKEISACFFLQQTSFNSPDTVDFANGLVCNKALNSQTLSEANLSLTVFADYIFSQISLNYNFNYLLEVEYLKEADDIPLQESDCNSSGIDINNSDDNNKNYNKNTKPISQEMYISENSSNSKSEETKSPELVVNEVILNMLLEIISNICKFQNSTKLKKLVNESSEIYDFLFKIYSILKNKKKNLPYSAYNHLLSKVFYIVSSLTYNLEICNKDFLNSKFLKELFNLENLKIKNLKNFTLVILNNICFKASQSIDDILTIVTQGLFKFIKTVLLESQDNQEINICLNCLYLVFEIGEKLENNNLLLEYEIHCGLDLLEKFIYSQCPKISTKAEDLIKKFFLIEKNMDYFMENGIPIQTCQLLKTFRVSNPYLTNNMNKSGINNTLGAIALTGIGNECFSNSINCKAYQAYGSFGDFTVLKSDNIFNLLGELDLNYTWNCDEAQCLRMQSDSLIIKKKFIDN